MEKEQFRARIKKYITLLSFYLNKKEAHDFVIDEKELSFFIKISEHHSLKAFLFQALKDCKVKVNEEIFKKAVAILWK